MNKPTILTAAATVALALSACGGIPASSTTDAPAGIAESSSPAAPSGTAESTETSAPETAEATKTAEEDGVTAFDNVYTWEDGLLLSVGKPGVFEPSEWAAGTENYTDFVVFEVRVINNTDAAWDPSLVYVTVQSGDKEAEQVFDSEKLGDQPATKLLPGRTAIFSVAFGVANPEDLVLEIAPDFEHESVLFHQ